MIIVFQRFYLAPQENELLVDRGGCLGVVGGLGEVVGVLLVVVGAVLGELVRICGFVGVFVSFGSVVDI